MQNDRIHVDPKLCQSCGMCVQGCPVEALSLSGEKKTLQEVMDVVITEDNCTLYWRVKVFIRVAQES